jgi:sec-independent protein translocase protein TatA
MFGLGMGELVIILVVVLLLFGAKKVPQLGEGLGKAIKGFKQGIKEEDEKEKIEKSDTE